MEPTSAPRPVTGSKCPTSTVVAPQRHTRSGLHGQLARVVPDSRSFAAAHLALLIDQADAGDWRTDTRPIPPVSGGVAAPSPSRRQRLARRWTRIRRSAFAADVRVTARGACTVAGLLGVLLLFRGLIVAAALAQAAVTR